MVLKRMYGERESQGGNWLTEFTLRMGGRVKGEIG